MKSSKSEFGKLECMSERLALLLEKVKSLAKITRWLLNADLGNSGKQLCGWMETRGRKKWRDLEFSGVAYADPYEFRFRFCQAHEI